MQNYEILLGPIHYHQLGPPIKRAVITTEDDGKYSELKIPEVI